MDEDPSSGFAMPLEDHEAGDAIVVFAASAWPPATVAVAAAMDVDDAPVTAAPVGAVLCK